MSDTKPDQKRKKKAKVQRIVIAGGWTWSAAWFEQGGPYATKHKYGTECRVFLVKRPTKMQTRRCTLILEVEGK